METNLNKVKLAIFSSRKLNEQSTLNKHKSTIENIIQNFKPNEVEITIGNIKNKLIINLLQSLEFDVLVIQQNNNSLYNSNLRIIEENEIIIFLRYEESPTIDEFLDYAAKLGSKVTIPVNLN